MKAETMAFTWEDMPSTLIPNTTMQKRLQDGVARMYKITPIEGYILHDKGRDMPIMDEETLEEVGIKLGYTDSYTTCAISYDFSTVTVTDENGVQHTAYGAREFFARPASEVPADQIFGGSNNDHVTM